MANYRKCPFPVRYRKTPRSEMAIYKIWAEDKFMIWKGLSLTQSVSLISEGIHRAFSSPPKEDSSISFLQKHIETTKCQWIEIEPLLYPETAFDMLVAEHRLLKEWQGHPDCLNVSFEPYIPKWIPVTVLNEYNYWKKNNL